VPLGQRGRDRLTNLQGRLDMAHPGQVGHYADHAVALLFGYTRRRRPEATNRPVAGRQVDVDRPRVAAGSHVPHDVVEPIDVVAAQVNCHDQGEIDYYWDKLTAGGSEGPCGWCKDRYELSWQIMPEGMTEFFADDPEGAARAAQAMFQMRKLGIATLEAARDGIGIAA
jgi:predicted 3-demethylubiquinone-9 3-methyltransferase (glyoxalase superfamily)